MVEAFGIHNFKCFTELDLPRLTRLTLVGGRNNVGKTALLEALFMFHDRLNPNLTLGQYARRGVASVPVTAEAVFAPVFTAYDLGRQIVLCARADGRDEVMTASYNPSYGALMIEGKQPVGANGAMVLPTDNAPTPLGALDISYQSAGREPDKVHLVLQPEGAGLKVDTLVTSGKRAGILGATGFADPNLVAIRYGELDIAQRHGYVVDALRILEPRLRTVSSVHLGPGSLLHGDIGLGRKIPVSYMGEGMARLLALMVFIGTCPGGIVLVDEIENGIHHSVMAKVWEAIGGAVRQFDCQIVATTHSYACIEAATEGLDGDSADDLSYIRLDRDAGQVAAKTYDRSTLDAAIANGFELR